MPGLRFWVHFHAPLIVWSIWQFYEQNFSPRAVWSESQTKANFDWRSFIPVALMSYHYAVFVLGQERKHQETLARVRHQADVNARRPFGRIGLPFQLSTMTAICVALGLKDNSSLPTWRQVTVRNPGGQLVRWGPNNSQYAQIDFHHPLTCYIFQVLVQIVNDPGLWRLWAVPPRPNGFLAGSGNPFRVCAIRKSGIPHPMADLFSQIFQQSGAEIAGVFIEAMVLYSRGKYHTADRKCTRCLSHCPAAVPHSRSQIDWPAMMGCVNLPGHRNGQCACCMWDGVHCSFEDVVPHLPASGDGEWVYGTAPPGSVPMIDTSLPPPTFHAPFLDMADLPAVLNPRGSTWS
ncbi:hypothetical protein BT63DRAFT_258566 [Microthyrium microscopicum]|uniref:Uncharacterized protein n=1 Tax=Microthyrium microscopicum TaxID=703497 RepID=A0A6A6UCJ7_9PEZI|nr:hypothetical protein BT63DRAFT_258566 [Microthyrium microscopicum]